MIEDGVKFSFLCFLGDTNISLIGVLITFGLTKPVEISTHSPSKNPLFYFMTEWVIIVIFIFEITELPFKSQKSMKYCLLFYFCFVLFCFSTKNILIVVLCCLDISYLSEWCVVYLHFKLWTFTWEWKWHSTQWIHKVWKSFRFSSRRWYFSYPCTFWF